MRVTFVPEIWQGYPRFMPRQVIGLGDVELDVGKPRIPDVLCCAGDHLRL